MEANNNRGDDSSSPRNNDSGSKSRKGKRKTLRVTSFPQSLPPEVAAQYLSQATAAAAVAWEKNSPKEGSTSSSPSKAFGPSRPPPSGSSSVSFGSLDLAALAQSGSLDFATAAAAASRSSSSGGENGAPPCSEAEMKALMSMFVEIMGMSMDSENTSSSSSRKASGGRSKSVTQAAKSFLAGASSGSANGGGSSFPVFMFGDSSSSPPSSRDIPPPPGGWPSSAAAAAVAAAAGMYSPRNDDSWGVDYYEDSDEDEDSIPDLDDIPIARKQKSDETETPTKSSPKGSGSKNDNDISPAVLAALEQVEMNDALQEEERARKAAKKREKKQRKKEKQKKEAALKASQAAQKKREKLVLSWRSRVVSACQSNEVSKLESLLSESPLRPPKTNDESEEESQAFIKTHMEYLLPNCIAKSRQQVEKGREARQKLTNFIMNWSAPLAFAYGRNGRAPIHTACFTGDVHFVQLVLERAAFAASKDSSVLPESYSTVECEDSGWTPLHYAVVSGSNAVVEALLREGFDLKKRTDESKTWRISNGQGITARELAEIVRSGKHDKILETHGDALKDVVDTHMENSNERSRFQRILEKIVDRLIDVERHGYSPAKDAVPAGNDANGEEERVDAKLPSRSSSSEDVSKKKKKKKKKDKSNQSENEQTKATPNNVVPVKQEDPMISALLGMGFSAEQIDAAAKACGGVERATADDLVAWIFAQESGETAATPANNDDSATNENEGPDEVEEVPFTDPTQQEKKKNAQEEREQAAAIAQQNLLEKSKREEEARIAAERLAAKREEQRRRNREWNNREQARQREEAQAKLTQEMERRARAEAQRAAIGRVAAAHPPQLHTGTNPQSMGVPQQVSYTPVAAPSALPVAPSMQPPQPQMSAPTHFLQSNGKVRPLGGLGHGGPVPVQHATPTQNQPAAYPVDARHGEFNTQMAAVPVAAVPMMNNPPPGYPSSFGQQQHVALPLTHSELQGQSKLDSGGFEFPDLRNEGVVDSRRMMVPPEDATVSSSGSGRPPRDIRVSSSSSTPSGPPGMNLSSSTPPPGFRPSSTTPNPPMTNEFVDEEPNPLGEIRATAKAFVPSNFTPAPQQNAKVASAPASVPSPTPPEFLSPSSRVARSTSDVAVSAYGGQQTGTEGPSMLDPVSSLLGGIGTLSSGSSSLLPTTSTRLSGNLDPSPVPSAASSVAGAPAGSSLLDSVPIGATTSGGDIWGSTGTSSAATTGTSIGGLPSFGMTDPTSSLGSIQAARSFGTIENVFGDPNKETEGSSGNWGAGDTAGGGTSNGMGSIW